MYAVKVGEFYVKNINKCFINEYEFVDEIVLSKGTIIKPFTKKRAKHIAKMVNGEIIDITC